MCMEHKRTISTTIVRTVLTLWTPLKSSSLSLLSSLLVCESPSVCGCFNHLKAPLVFSGNDDGTLVVWDLRENVAMHTTPPGTTKTGLIPRLPTFSTGMGHIHMYILCIGEVSFHSCIISEKQSPFSHSHTSPHHYFFTTSHISHTH